MPETSAETKPKERRRHSRNEGVSGKSTTTSLMKKITPTSVETKPRRGGDIAKRGYLETTSNPKGVIWIEELGMKKDYTAKALKAF